MVRLEAVLVRQAVVDYIGVDESAFEEDVFKMALKKELSQGTASNTFYLKNEVFLLGARVYTGKKYNATDSHAAQEQDAAMVSLAVDFELDIISESNNFAEVSLNVTRELQRIFTTPGFFQVGRCLSVSEWHAASSSPLCVFRRVQLLTRSRYKMNQRQ